MTQTKQLGSALFAIVIALPLISMGLTADISLIWGVGLLLLIIGAAMPIYAKVNRGDSCEEKSKRRAWHRTKYPSQE